MSPESINRIHSCCHTVNINLISLRISEILVPKSICEGPRDVNSRDSHCQRIFHVRCVIIENKQTNIVYIWSGHIELIPYLNLYIALGCHWLRWINYWECYTCVIWLVHIKIGCWWVHISVCAINYLSTECGVIIFKIIVKWDSPVVVMMRIYYHISQEIKFRHWCLVSNYLHIERGCIYICWSTSKVCFICYLISSHKCIGRWGYI